ncbi:acetate--CoA ligase family protein [Chloroflexota bacterium]
MDLVEQLNRIFFPGAVAVIGASANPQKVGYICVANLVEAGFRGRIYPVNPNLSQLLGLKVYPSIEAIPDAVDLAMIVIPAELVIPAVEECAAKGVTGVIVISSGFKEVDTGTGRDLQTRLRDIANRSGIRIMGPNTVGFVNPRAKLVASFQTTLQMSQPGNVGIATQSGGMCSYLVHALTNHNTGISKAIGMGNRCNLDFDEIVSYFSQDTETDVIILYIEGLEQPERLMAVARETVRRKPILVYKGGRSQDSSRATLSHTGALAGNQALYKAAFTQSGIININDITDIVDTAKALALQSPTAGNRIAVLSVQAGGGIIIADRCRELGLKLAAFSPATRERLKSLASPLNSIDNPVDIAWKSDEYDASREILKTVLEDEGVDAAIVAALYYASNMQLIQAVIDTAGEYKKPVTVCLDSPLGAASSQLEALERSHIPAYSLPERAVTGMAGLVKYGEIIRSMR